MSDLKQALQAAENGVPHAAETLLPLVYTELRRLAAYRMAQEKPGHTLQPTSLVHEAWLRLAGQSDQKWAGRAHFFSAAAEAMRRILIEAARRRAALRHGGGQVRLDVDEIDVPAGVQDAELLAVNEALEKFAGQEPRKAELLKLRYFVGLSIAEAAQVMGISAATANRWWSYSRAWLYQELGAGEQPSGST